MTNENTVNKPANITLELSSTNLPMDTMDRTYNKISARSPPPTIPLISTTSIRSTPKILVSTFPDQRIKYMKSNDNMQYKIYKVSIHPWLGKTPYRYFQK